MVSLADYFSHVIQYRGLRHCSFRSTKNEKKTVKQPVVRPGKSARSKAIARCKKTSTTSRWHHMYLLMVRSPRLSSVFVASAPCSKNSTLVCTTEFVPLNWGNLAFHEKTCNGDWRAFVTDPTRICRHGSPLPHTRASTHLWSLPLTTSICNFTLAARLSFSILIHVLCAAPIKAPLDCFSIPIRSTFWCWNFIFEGCLHWKLYGNYYLWWGLTVAKSEVSLKLHSYIPWYQISN